MKVSLELPDSVASDPGYLKEALVATLYFMGRLSERHAREALGMTRRAFEEMLPRFRLSVFIEKADET
jgi:hypothetical protein